MSEPSFEVRRLSFGAAASEYDAFRPGYARGAVSWVFAGARGQVRRVLDVGAGTGALTRALVDLGLGVTAVDPDPAMLGVLAANLPDVECVAGAAESLPVASGSVDAVTVGQAFHWFDAPAARDEFARVLRPGGVVGILWNHRDDRVAWMADLRPLVGGVDWQLDGDSSGPDLEALFPGVESEEFPHALSVSPDQLVGLVGTFSFVRLRDDAPAILDSVREFLASHPDTRGRAILEVPYVTAAHRFTRP